MVRRVESPSSIKTYKQCPRKYYYTYIKKIPTKSNIHQVRGNIAHSVLEKFFDIDPGRIGIDNFERPLQLIIQQMLINEWQGYKKELDEVGITREQEIFYFEETMMMLLKWLGHFIKKVKKEKGTFEDRFKKLTPIREQEYTSDVYHIRGFIDAIEKLDEGVIRLMDYKTNKKFVLDDHKLQLGIYSLLYYEKHNVLPTHVGIYFLKDKEHVMEFDEDLMKAAKREIAYIHEMTVPDNMEEYPRQVTGLCRWRTGQCDYYDICRPHG